MRVTGSVQHHAGQFGLRLLGDELPGQIVGQHPGAIRPREQQALNVPPPLAGLETLCRLLLPPCLQGRDRTRIDAVGYAKARPEIFLVGIDQAAVQQAAAGGFLHAVRGWIEV